MVGKKDKGLGERCQQGSENLEKMQNEKCKVKSEKRAVKNATREKDVVHFEFCI